MRLTAFEQLARRCAPKLLRYSTRQLGNHDATSSSLTGSWGLKDLPARHSVDPTAIASAERLSEKSLIGHSSPFNLGVFSCC